MNFVDRLDVWTALFLSGQQMEEKEAAGIYEHRESCQQV